jgi:hypothetical protein
VHNSVLEQRVSLNERMGLSLVTAVENKKDFRRLLVSVEGNLSAEEHALRRNLLLALVTMLLRDG